MLLALACGYASAQCGSPSYTEPDFTIAVQNPECPKVGEIKVISATGGVGPYTYTLIPGNISSSTGVFTNLAPGNYMVQLRDACGNIRSRQATISPYGIASSSSAAPLGCATYGFTINCSVNGPALQYGYSVNGSPVIWGDSAYVRLKLSFPAQIVLYVKDSCGNQASSSQYLEKDPDAHIKQLRERIMCNGQEIYPEYFGFTSARVCLYKSPQNTLVECKYAPTPDFIGGAETNFFNLPFGQDYYVIVDDGCHRDSAFFKDKTSVGGSEMNPFNWKCSTFDIHVDGNGSDSICLYNAVTNQLVSCKVNCDTCIDPNTGAPWAYQGAEFYDVPYGSYYAYIFDPCEDTLIRIDTTVRFPYKSSARVFPSCMIGQSAVAVNFAVETPKPWTTYVYWPNDSLVATFQSSGSNWYHHYPTYPFAGTTKVITQDGCGNRDTSYLTPPPLLATRWIEIKGGCPGILGESGGGDIILHGNAAAYAGMGTGTSLASIKIIKKDSLSVNIPQTFTQFNSATNEQDFFFTNLSTGVYVLESTVGCNGLKIYDTVNIMPYVYPEQEQTHITQCGSNPFVFRDTITGGLAPYTYEIVGTNPHVSSLLTGIQSSNIFSIPPGTNLNTITIQVIDACGNSNTKEFPVNKLANCMPLLVDSTNYLSAVQNKSVSVFPNPSGKHFNIAFSQKKKTDYQIEIYNTSGIRVYWRTLMNVDKKNLTVTENLVPGAYIINISDLKSKRQYYHKQLIL